MNKPTENYVFIDNDSLPIFNAYFIAQPNNIRFVKKTKCGDKKGQIYVLYDNDFDTADQLFKQTAHEKIAVDVFMEGVKINAHTWVKY